MKDKNKDGTVEFTPLIQKCTYHHKDADGVCKNCNDTMKYQDGFYLTYEKDGKKFGFFVDTLK